MKSKNFVSCRIPLSRYESIEVRPFEYNPRDEYLQDPPYYKIEVLGTSRRASFQTEKALVMLGKSDLQAVRGMIDRLLSDDDISSYLDEVEKIPYSRVVR